MHVQHSRRPPRWTDAAASNRNSTGGLHLNTRVSIIRRQKRLEPKPTAARRSLPVPPGCERTPAPEGLTPDRLPDPWLFDSERLLAEMTRIRELILLVPVTMESFAPINTVVDAAWRLEQQLRFLLHLHREGQRSFAQKSNVVPAASTTEQPSIAAS